MSTFNRPATLPERITYALACLRRARSCDPRHVEGAENYLNNLLDRVPRGAK